MIRLHSFTTQYTLGQSSTGPQIWKLFLWLSVCFLGINPPSVMLAESTQSITLLQAIKIAVEQNPDVLLARLDVKKATHSVREAKAPFSPKLHVGSGLAVSSGIPQSVDGALSLIHI